MSSTEMKSYLSLIPISAKVRRRQNRMTILCIVLAVFLVTAVFSMADMAIRMETSNQLNKNGNWHIMVKDISPETAAELAAQEDVAAFSAYSDINASLTENYFAGDKRAALVGADDAIIQIFPGMQCSTAPADGEVLVTANIRDWLDVTVGTAIPLTLPDGQTISLTVAGFNEDTSDANQYDAVVLVMNRSTFSQIAAKLLPVSGQALLPCRRVLSGRIWSKRCGPGNEKSRSSLAETAGSEESIDHLRKHSVALLSGIDLSWSETEFCQRTGRTERQQVYQGI